MSAPVRLVPTHRHTKRTDHERLQLAVWHGSDFSIQCITMTYWLLAFIFSLRHLLPYHIRRRYANNQSPVTTTTTTMTKSGASSNSCAQVYYFYIAPNYAYKRVYQAALNRRPGPDDLTATQQSALTFRSSAMRARYAISWSL